MFSVGRICIKLAGRDSNNKCVVVEVLENNYVLIDGETRRKKCNIIHLEPLDKKIDIKSKASHEDVISAFKKIGIEIKDTKPKKAGERPRKLRKVSKKPIKEEKPKSKPVEVKSKTKPTEVKKEIKK